MNIQRHNSTKKVIMISSNTIDTLVIQNGNKKWCHWKCFMEDSCKKTSLHHLSFCQCSISNVGYWEICHQEIVSIICSYLSSGIAFIRDMWLSFTKFHVSNYLMLMIFLTIFKFWKKLSSVSLIYLYRKFPILYSTILKMSCISLFSKSDSGAVVLSIAASNTKLP